MSNPAPRPTETRPLTLLISMMNLTTDTEIQNGRKFFGGNWVPENRELRILIDELTENGLVLTVPVRCGAVGHRLGLAIRAENTPIGNVNINLEVVIDQVESFGDGNDRLTVSLAEGSEQDWEKLQALMGQRQDEIVEFMLAARG